MYSMLVKNTKMFINAYDICQRKKIKSLKKMPFHPRMVIDSLLMEIL